ncbi:kinase with adenine nucleotide alpha hydrolases-like domain-containing protein [Actinidia rufa]|uniref:Kinase with adenine nucleotide alpha hydrolases-like domain-containing protein n=1 Tax=Actinidia rufa TaxID=165716 RepID=A0A7J0DAZ4_9ERIC|nr:kinase with adenine nucleotide alpha hydrolases-like domain-containing protein [Actinidia rufa]
MSEIVASWETDAKQPLCNRMGHWECDQTYGFPNPTCSSTFEPPSSSTGSWQSNSSAVLSSRIYQFFSGLLKKRDAGHDDDKSAGTVDDEHSETVNRIYSVCVQMMQQLLSLHNVVQVRAQVKVVVDAQMGSVATVAEELGATWVILDQRLKKEADCCLRQSNCDNIILIDHAIPNILRSVNYLPNANNHDAAAGGVILSNPPTVSDMLGMLPYNPKSDTENSLRISKDQSRKTSPVTKFKKPPQSSPHSHFDSHFSGHEAETEASRDSTPSYSKSQTLSKVSNFDIESPPKSSGTPIDKKARSYNSLPKTRSHVHRSNRLKATESSSFSPRSSLDSKNSLQKLESTPNQSGKLSKSREFKSNKANEAVAFPPTTLDRASSVRRAISLSIKQPPIPPPLCSICKHNAPIFGKAPRKFSYKEIERATNGFSTENFLAEGGYGRAVYRGVLPNGLVVAVKQHKMLSAQGASEFCSEVEILSSAQHKNLVMLVGYCVDTEWLLVYEFACNGSLDKHLYGTETNKVMAWHKRMKVAVGAARGLRYLHEDCRVGCIVHRDFRPTNILLTHDFGPMVGDFGLARWQVDGQLAEETRVIGAFGYLAPEYTETGLVTEKADVYSFGVVLLELLTGIKATEFSRTVRRQQLPRQGSLLNGKIHSELIDPRLANNYIDKEAECMFHAAILCISPDPERRPRITKILKILEGDLPSYAVSHDHGQSGAFYPKKSLNNRYTSDGPWYQVLDSGPSSHLMQSIQHMKMDVSPPTKSTYRNNVRKSGFKSTPLSNGYKVESSGLDTNQSEQIVYQDYQQHLQGSLLKFIKNLNVN